MSGNNLYKSFIFRVFLFISLMFFFLPLESFARDKTRISNNTTTEYDLYQEPSKDKTTKAEVDHITNKLLVDLHALENEHEQDSQSENETNNHNGSSEINLKNADSHNPDMIESIGRGNLRTMPYAEIIVLNKITAKSEKIIFKVGEVKFFNNISVEVNKCVNNPSIFDPNNMMLMTVFDNKIATDKLSVFHGWMFSNNFSISSLEHPVYELLPQRCLPNAL